MARITQLFRYDLNYNNNSAFASGKACLSDTLPLSTSLVSWQSQNGYALWSQVSLIGQQLTLCAPVSYLSFATVATVFPFMSVTVMVTWLCSGTLKLIVVEGLNGFG